MLYIPGAGREAILGEEARPFGVPIVSYGNSAQRQNHKTHNGLYHPSS